MLLVDTVAAVVVVEDLFLLVVVVLAVVVSVFENGDGLDLNVSAVVESFTCKLLNITK